LQEWALQESELQRYALRDLHCFAMRYGIIPTKVFGFQFTHPICAIHGAIAPFTQTLFAIHL
jgi:hypothetical protein